MAKVNWLEIKAAYQSGEGTYDELSKRFGITKSAIEKRASKEKWRSEIQEIAEKVQERVIEKSSDVVADYIKKKIKRITRCEGDIDASREQFPEDEQGRVVMDMLNVKHMLQAEAQADDIVRKALGIPDAPQKIEVSYDITERLLAARRRIKKVE